MATTDKYDRQLRLWGASGQHALSTTNVVLVGCSASGTETLKNLVLPGVGSFLVLDDANARSDSFEDDCEEGDVIKDGNDSNFCILPCNEADRIAIAPSMKFASSSSSNFFAPPPSPHCRQTKAAMACALLSELNPDVSGFHCTMPSLETLNYNTFLESLLDNIRAAVGATTIDHIDKILIVSADQPSTVLIPLSYACSSLSIPLIHVRAYGLLGSVRIQTPSPYHYVLETKSNYKVMDLRLSSYPLFEGLNSIHNSTPKLDSMVDSKEHSHVPFVIILLQALDKWRDISSAKINSYSSSSTTNDFSSQPTHSLHASTNFPQTIQEKEIFRKLIKSMANDWSKELNFQEAYDHAHLAWADDITPENTQEVLNRVLLHNEILHSNIVDTGIDKAREESSDITNIGTARRKSFHSIQVMQFELMVLALNLFLEKNDNHLPLEGTIPDMTSDTKSFVALQEAYKDRAEKDKVIFTKCMHKIFDTYRKKYNGSSIYFPMPSDEDVTKFCKNSRFIRMLETRPLYAEYRTQDPSSPIVNALSKSLPLDHSTISNFDDIQSESREDLLSAAMDPYETDPIQTPLLWWIALRACDAFYDRHGSYPGKHNQTFALEADAAEVYKLMLEIVSNLGLKECELIKDTLLDEMKGRDLAREVVRYDEAEIHSIAAIVGGVASQEAVKLITRQFVPVNDTYVYNGIASTAGVYRF